jgi:hypothetical protein
MKSDYHGDRDAIGKGVVLNVLQKWEKELPASPLVNGKLER